MKSNTILPTSIFVIFVVSISIIFVTNPTIYADNKNYQVQIDEVKISNDKTKLSVDITAKIL